MPEAATTKPPPLADLVVQLESNNRNIMQELSTRDVNNNYGRGGGNPAQGYFQIITPTWQRYAPGAGVDLTKYPNALSAPKDIQAQVAKAIPFNQWGPRTVAIAKQYYPGIDTSKTLGELNGDAPISPGGAPAKPSFAQAVQAGDYKGALAALDQKDQGGLSPLDHAQKAMQAFSGGGQQQQQAPPPMRMDGAPPNIPNRGDASQVLNAAIASGAQPLAWRAGVPQSAAGPQNPQPYQPGITPTPGMTLNSLAMQGGFNPYG